MERKEETSYAYRLQAFGDKNLLDKCIDQHIINVSWNTQEDFVIKRILFPRLPESPRQQISRDHFKIQCVHNEQSNEQTMVLTDLSFNGTVINNAILGKSKRSQLKNGNDIGILHKISPNGSIHIMLGWKFIDLTSSVKKRKLEDVLTTSVNSKKLKTIKQYPKEDTIEEIDLSLIPPSKVSKKTKLQSLSQTVKRKTNQHSHFLSQPKVIHQH